MIKARSLICGECRFTQWRIIRPWRFASSGMGWRYDGRSLALIGLALSIRVPNSGGLLTLSHGVLRRESWERRLRGQSVLIASWLLAIVHHHRKSLLRRKDRDRRDFFITISSLLSFNTSCLLINPAIDRPIPCWHIFACGRVYRIPLSVATNFTSGGDAIGPTSTSRRLGEAVWAWILALLERGHGWHNDITVAKAR